MLEAEVQTIHYICGTVLSEWQKRDNGEVAFILANGLCVQSNLKVEASSL